MNKALTRCAAILLAGLPFAALAHTGHADDGFFAGLAHPFNGLDHLLAMLVVGVWSLLHARQAWLAPGAFVVFLAAGSVLGQQGVALPQLEVLLAGSVVVLGAMLALRRQFSPTVALAVVAGFALVHGIAHGGELAIGRGVLFGIVLGSAALHAAGIGFAHVVLRRRPALARRAGQFVAALGGGLVLASVLA